MPSAKAQQRALDITINQRLDINFVDRENNGLEAVRRSMMMTSDDISSFARFLTENRCLEVLLFWKEVEQFKSLFSPDEKAALFKKIFDLYCCPGALWQVNFRGAYFKDIEEAMRDGGLKGDVSDEVFDQAQEEVYELMRLDLYPRFCDSIEKVSTIGETEEKA